LNTAAAIASVVLAVLTFLGMSGRWVSKIIDEVRRLLVELKNNTKAVNDLGDKVDGNQSAVLTTLNDHEVRIVKLESKETGQ